MERAGSAECEQREGARVVAAFNGDASESRFHAGVGYAEDAFGEVFEGCERSGGDCGKSFARAGFVETHSAAEEVIGMQAAEGEVGIGYGGAFSAAVARWAGNGSGGLRTDLQRTGCVHPGEGAAACAGGMNVEHGNADGESGHLTFCAGGRFACGVKESYVGRCAAHVEGEDAVDAGGSGYAERADDTAGGA